AADMLPEMTAFRICSVSLKCDRINFSVGDPGGGGSVLVCGAAGASVGGASAGASVGAGSVTLAAGVGSGAAGDSAGCDGGLPQPATATAISAQVRVFMFAGLT
ncbi:MAG TPA: hypothetical protein PKD61_16720, partial [Polyangiaceae bacterium]|nr:hypothetical protein [Polyangiaceae bacterium]